MAHYHDMVRADGSYDQRAILQVAWAKARQELAEIRIIAGKRPTIQPFDLRWYFANELRKVWQVAQLSSLMRRAA